MRADALGGDAYWSTGLSLITPVPFLFKYANILKSHAFINAGSLVTLDPSINMTNIHNFFDTF